jgi:hypothetical protein
MELRVSRNVMTKNKRRFLFDSQQLVQSTINVVAGVCRGEGPLAPTMKFVINGFSMWRRGAAWKQAKLRQCAPTVRFGINGVSKLCRGVLQYAPTVKFEINDVATLCRGLPWQTPTVSFENPFFSNDTKQHSQQVSL